jgi:hypothetical protein
LRYVLEVTAIIAESIAGVYWRLAGQFYGIGDTVVGAFASVGTFLVVIAIGEAREDPLPHCLRRLSNPPLLSSNSAPSFLNNYRLNIYP